MIEARNLKKVYAPKKGVEVHALDDVSLRLPDTGMVFILGKSGSGKSTLLNVLGGLDTIDSGEIIIKGQSTKDFKQSGFDSYRNTYVGFIFQEYNILEEFTVGANIALAIELQGRKATNQEINDILAEVDLTGLGSRKPNELSGGQKQRVAIARALVKKPEIIMADEPTGALDSNTGRQVFDTLKELSKNKLVLIVSHDREFSELYADRIIELADGKIISDVEYDKEATENAEEPNLSYVGKEITIKDGYELTSEDIEAINAYIKKIKGNTSLIINDKRQNKIFKTTDESKIENKQGLFKTIKSKLSVKNAFKLGSSGLKHKKVRLVFTILLSFIAFSLFGLADSIASYDSINTCTTSLIDSGIDYASFIKETKYFYDESDPDGFYWQDWGNQVSTDEIAILEQQTGLKFLPVLGGDGLYLQYASEVASSSSSSDSRYDWSRVYPSEFSGVSVLSQEIISSFNYSLTSGSKLPENNNEIVIPSFIAEYYVKNGFLQYNEDTKTSDIIKINSIGEMVGKEITIQVSWNLPTQKYKIVGVLDTGFDTSRYEALADTRNENIFNMVVNEELDAAKSHSLNAVMFINQDFFDVLNAIVHENRQNVKQGNFELMTYKDKNANLDDNNYSSWPSSYYNLHKLSQINASKIQWLTDSPVTTLGKYDVILPISQAREFINNYNYGFDGDKENESFNLFEIEIKDGIELEYASRFGATNLEGIQNNLIHLAAYDYAIKNLDSAIDYIKTKDTHFDENSYVLWDEETETNVLNTQEIAYIFADYAVRYGCDLYDAKILYDSIMEKYGISDKVVTYEQYKNRVIYFPNGSSYELFYGIMKSNYHSNRYDIFYADLAMDTFEDAVKEAEKATEKPRWYHTDNLYDYEKEEYFDVPNYYMCFSDYKNEYYWACNGNEQECSISSSEIERAKTAYANYVFDEIKNATYNLAIRYELWGKEQTRDESKDARIVGVTTETGIKVVVADEVYDLLVDEISMGDYSYVVAPMPDGRDDVHNISAFSYENEHYDGMARFALKNSVTEELGMIDDTLEVLGQVFLWVGVGFAVFASLMLSNFIATSISYKKQEIGILRAIGSRSNDVFMIFFAESFIISMINFVLALFTTGTVVYVINGVFREDLGLLVTFLTFGIRQIGLLLGVSLLVAIIATFFPVKKIASMKPIDAIKNRK